MPIIYATSVTYGNNVASIRFVLPFLFVAFARSTYALSLDAIEVTSALGQPLRAKIAIPDLHRETVAATCIKARVASADGVFLTNPQVHVSNTGKAAVVALSSIQSIDEPAIRVIIELHCASRMTRTYDVLLDPLHSVAGEPALLIAPSSLVIPAANGQGNVDATSASRLKRRKEDATGSGDRPKTGTALVKLRTKKAKTEAKARPQKKMAPSDARQSGAVLRLSNGTDEPDGSAEKNNTPQGKQVSTNAPVTASEQPIATLGQTAAPSSPIPLQASAAEAEIKALQQKLLSLEVTIAELRRQNEAARLTTLAEAHPSFPPIWVMGLAALFLLNLIVMIWLASRYQRREKDDTFTSDAHLPFDHALSSTVLVSSAPAAVVPNRVDDDFFDAGDLENNTTKLTREHADNVTEFRSSGVSESELGKKSVERDVAVLDFVDTDENFIAKLRASSGPAGRNEKALAVELEEVTDIIQEVDFWILINKPEEALRLLIPYADVEQPDSPITWLYLLDLHQTMKHQVAYKELAVRFKRVFNARIPEWNESPETFERSSLEDFPALIDRICANWQSDQIVPFLESLLVDDRGGERIGFDLPVYKEIILLISVANQIRA